MKRFFLIFILGLITTSIHSQIEQCEILHITNAIVISEYLPLSPSRTKFYYVEGNKYIYYNGVKVHFMPYSDFNKHIIEKYESNVFIPECLHKSNSDWILDWLNSDYTYDLRFSIHDGTNYVPRGEFRSNDFYRHARKKKIYVAYCFDGEIVVYRMKRKIVLQRGFEDQEYTLKPTRCSKFAVLKKADNLRSLTVDEAISMRLKKVSFNCINIFRAE